MSEILACVEIDPPRPAGAAVIWMHGLGADGHDFEPIVPYLGLDDLAVRFVFPHAPRRPVSINMGLIMRAWYDIRGITLQGDTDRKGIGASVVQIDDLVRRERERGIAASRIVLAGFSQGGVIALHAALGHEETLAGVVALSTYLPTAEDLESAWTDANARLPIFQGHGEADGMIPLELGEAARDRLRERGHAVEWRTYPVEHGVHPEEIADVGAWLRLRLQPARGASTSGPGGGGSLSGG